MLELANQILQPLVYRPLDQLLIHSLSDQCVGQEMLNLSVASYTTRAWTANRLIFIPFATASRVLVSGFWWYNGTTANGSTDVGIYTEDGQTKLGSSGATLNSGTSVLQDVNVTDFFLPAGRRLWLTLGSDSATQTYFSLPPTAVLQDFVGIKEQLSGWSSGLPSTITPATPTVAVFPHFGLRGSSVI
jgi:hypothetical protein